MNLDERAKKKKERVNNNLKEIFDYFRDVKEYYQRHCEKDHYVRMTIELIREAIQHRYKSNSKHYHVAYIKHHRFLSPTDKSTVTPKITEIIPITTTNIHIFQKPKGKVKNQKDNQQVNKIYNQEEDNNQMGKNLAFFHQINRKEVKNSNKEDGNVEQSSKYLSPKQILEQQQAKLRKNQVKTSKKQIQSSKISKQFSSTSHMPSKLNIQSNYQTLKQNKLPNSFSSKEIKSPRYDLAESKIKFLIDRDKQNRKLQNLIGEQNKKIERLSQRQEKLLSQQLIEEKRASIIRDNIQNLLQEAESSLQSSLEKEIYSSKKIIRNSLEENRNFKDKYKIQNGIQQYGISDSQSSEMSQD